MSFKVKPEAIWRVVDDEALILNTATGFYFSLNASGSMILGLLTEGRTIDETAEIVAKTYNAPVDTVKQDVIELIQSLKDEQLVE